MAVAPCCEWLGTTAYAVVQEAVPPHHRTVLAPLRRVTDGHVRVTRSRCNTPITGPSFPTRCPIWQADPATRGRDTGGSRRGVGGVARPCTPHRHHTHHTQHRHHRRRRHHRLHRHNRQHRHRRPRRRATHACAGAAPNPARPHSATAGTASSPQSPRHSPSAERTPSPPPRARPTSHPRSTRWSTTSSPPSPAASVNGSPDAAPKRSCSPATSPPWKAPAPNGPPANPSPTAKPAAPSDTPKSPPATSARTATPSTAPTHPLPLLYGDARPLRRTRSRPDHREGLNHPRCRRTRRTHRTHPPPPAPASPKPWTPRCAKRAGSPAAGTSGAPNNGPTPCAPTSPPCGHQHAVFPAAVEAWAEFGGLRITGPAPGRQTAPAPVTIDPLSGLHLARTLADLGRALDTEIAPLGDEGDGRALLAIDTEGRIYSIDHTGDWYLGHDIDQGLTTLITGLNAARLGSG